MTPNELADLPVKDLEDMSDAQLESHLKAYFPFTRPDKPGIDVGEEDDRMKELVARAKERAGVVVGTKSKGIQLPI
jgi:hypothetical protein